MTIEFVMTIMCSMGGLAGLGLMIINTGLKGDNNNKQRAWIYSGKFKK